MKRIEFQNGNYHCFMNIYEYHEFNNCSNRRGGVEVERSSRMREIEIRFPVATDLSRKNT